MKASWAKLDPVQARSQAEASKPGLQHHMGIDARNPDFVTCEQQRRRPGCAFAQSDQRYCNSLSLGQASLNSPFVVGFNMTKSLATPQQLKTYIKMKVGVFGESQTHRPHTNAGYHTEETQDNLSKCVRFLNNVAF